MEMETSEDAATPNTSSTDEDYHDPDEILRQQLELEDDIEMATCHAIATQYMEEGNISKATCLHIEATGGK